MNLLYKKFLLIFLFWLSLSVILISRTGSVNVDSFQSLGALADSNQPGELHWPMLGEFMGYDQTWGFHWLGWPMLRSVLLPLLTWYPLTELVLLCTIWFTAAWLVMRLAKAAGDTKFGYRVGLISLLAPGFLVAAQSYRPEIPTALFLLLALRYWNANKTLSIVARTVVLIILPLLHPLGVIVPGSWIAWDLLRNGRKDGWKIAIIRCLARGAALLLGLCLMAAWFVIHPDAWSQFQSNIKSQRLLIEGMGKGWLTFFYWGLGSKSSLPLIGLLLGAVIAAVTSLIDDWRKPIGHESYSARAYASVGVLVVLLFNILAKNPNSLHLVSILPLAAWLYLIFLQAITKNLPQLARQGGYAASIMVFLLLPFKQTYLLIRNHGQSYRAALQDVLDQLPSSRKVLIPVAMWEAAQMQLGQNQTAYQFSTFPNILERKQRLRYEETVVADLRPGDLLVWDPLQESDGIFNFVKTTALRHVLIHPQKQPAEWERLPDIKISISYSKSQANQFEVYRKRAP